MADGGWIKLYRKVLDDHLWQLSNPVQKVIMITLLLMANHAAKDWEWSGRKFIVQPGQFITSLDSIQARAGSGVTTQNVRTSLRRFEKMGFLTNQSTKTGRLITIVNWGKYQSPDDEANKATNRQLTDDQQRPNKELTPNKNVKNEKNEKKDLTTTTTAESELVNFWENNGFGMISPKNREDLMYWVDDFKKIGSTEDQAVGVVKKAMSNSIDNNVRRYAYVNAILKNWETQKLTNVEAVEAFEAKRSQDKKPRSSSGRSSPDVYQNQGDVSDDDLPF